MRHGPHRDAACLRAGRVAPDLTIKGLGGYQPLGAGAAIAKDIRCFANGSGFFSTATPMGRWPRLPGCRAADDPAEIARQCVAMGTELETRLTERLGNHRHVGDIRGRGLFRGVELVADRASKHPFDPKLKLNARIKKEAMARGLMVYPMGGTIDGRLGDHVLLAPPFIVDRSDISRIVERLGDAIDAAIASLPIESTNQGEPR